MKGMSGKMGLLLALVLVVSLLAGCSIGARVAQQAVDQAVENLQDSETEDAEADAPEETADDSAATEETTEGEDAATSGPIGEWDKDIPAVVPEFTGGKLQADQAGKYTTDEGSVIAAGFVEASKVAAKEYIETLKAKGFEMSTMETDSDITAYGSIDDGNQISIVCSYTDNDKVFSIVVTVANKQ